MSDGLINVMEHQRAGWLDEILQDETDRDLAAILRYIRVEKQTIADNPGRSTPSIARSVLTAFWQRPRTKFHSEGIAGNIEFDFGSKLLYIPWSIEALDRLKLQNSIKGLVLEHVTPIEALWKELVDLEANSESNEEWAVNAQGYLWVNYTLAVVTKEQAAAIDASELKTRGFKGKPFFRYHLAAERIRKKAAEGESVATLDVARFTEPGVGFEKFIEELIAEDEDRDDV